MARLRKVWGALGRWFALPWHPFVISAYPVLALLAENAGQVELIAGLRPLLVSVLFAALVFFIFWLVFRQVHRAALLASLWLALFFSYGHVYLYLEEKYPESSYATWLPIVWGILFLVTVLWAARPKVTFASAAPTLNTVALALLVMSAWQIVPDLQPRSAHALALPAAPIDTNLTPPENPPDVYFFLLDSYGRPDLLRQAYGLDIGGFLNALDERGFFVAECSQSNYIRTEISLASSLNMQYLQDLSEKFTPESTARRLLWDSLKHNAVRYNFEEMGYEVITFETGFPWLNITDADHFLSPPAVSSGITEFESLFLRTTFARYVQDWGWVDPSDVIGVVSRDRFNYAFDSIDDISQMPEPTFSYIHLISPHPPFVFDANGNPTDPADFWNEKQVYPADLYAEGYSNQVQFLNKKLIEAVDTILANSDAPPIIIIQGDHGPWLQPRNKRMWILTAIYFPGHKDKLYDTISPVNTFRLAFNLYFGGKYDKLADISYFSPVPHLYEFSEVPNSCGE